MSISFYDPENDEESVVLFDHWGGQEFPAVAQQYVDELKNDLKEIDPTGVTPLGRLEPNTVMVDFVRWLTRKDTFKDSAAMWATMTSRKDKKDVPEHVTSSYYFGRTDKDGDNSDNGHFRISLG